MAAREAVGAQAPLRQALAEFEAMAKASISDVGRLVRGRMAPTENRRIRETRFRPSLRAGRIFLRKSLFLKFAYFPYTDGIFVYFVEILILSCCGSSVVYFAVNS
jgi:hypothetical protein